MDILTLYLPYFLIYGVYLYRRRPVLALAIPLIFVPKILAQVIKSRMHLDLEEKTAPLIRKEEGICVLCRRTGLCERNAAAEYRWHLY